jgi:uncharacterized membrane protein
VKKVFEFTLSRLIAGVLVIAPVYLAALLLLKVMKSLAAVVRPFANLMPGFALFRSLTQRVAGKTQDSTWQPALVEIEEALVPAFIIEELEDGSFTVFVPSVPTPLAGSVYILSPERVHRLDVPFTQAIKTVSRWGSGSKDLVAAMEKKKAGSD